MNTHLSVSCQPKSLHRQGHGSKIMPYDSDAGNLQTNLARLAR
jgi:hypothetical protein